VRRFHNYGIRPYTPLAVTFTISVEDWRLTARLVPSPGHWFEPELAEELGPTIETDLEGWVGVLVPRERRTLHRPRPPLVTATYQSAL